MSHHFVDLTAQLDSLIETESLILNNDPVWCYHADAELMCPLDVFTKETDAMEVSIYDLH